MAGTTTVAWTRLSSKVRKYDRANIRRKEPNGLQTTWILAPRRNDPGVRYREALDTTDKREAKELEKDRIAAIKQGKGASKTGREFARKPFGEAAKIYLTERKPHVSERTTQFEKERLGPLSKHFGDKLLLRFKAEDMAEYQTVRLEAGVSGRTVNMETGVLRRMLKRAKVWNAIAEDVKALPERQEALGRALPAELKRKLFEAAASKPEWLVAHCAAVLAVSPPVAASSFEISAGRTWTCLAELP